MDDASKSEMKAATSPIEESLVKAWLRKFVEGIAALGEERNAWEQEAKAAMANTDYYRGLVIKIGEMFGEAAKTQDDGGKVEDVLCAKVPELVEAALKELYMLRADKQLSS
jgi:hypothetical protein